MALSPHFFEHFIYFWVTLRKTIYHLWRPRPSRIWTLSSISPVWCNAYRSRCQGNFSKTLWNFCFDWHLFFWKSSHQLCYPCPWTWFPLVNQFTPSCRQYWYPFDSYAHLPLRYARRGSSSYPLVAETCVSRETSLLVDYFSYPFNSSIELMFDIRLN